jgi:hypothetical protein
MKKSPLLGGDQGVGLGMHPLELEQKGIFQTGSKSLFEKSISAPKGRINIAQGG